MKIIENKIKFCIKNLKSYEPVLFKGKYKLDANENSYDLPKLIKRKILKKILNIPVNRYPDPEARSLKKILSKKLKVKKDMIFIGNGSDEIIFYLAQSFLEKDDVVIIPVPTFEMYKIISKINAAQVIEIPLTKDFDIDDKNIIKYAKITKAKFIFIAYPNNPTGNCFSKDKILNIIKNTDAIVIIDEAYFEFSEKTFIKYLKKFKNLVILRTFSKAYSIAALRVGYMIANKEIVKILNKIKLPYNANSISQVFAKEVLLNEKYLKDNIKKIISEKEKLYEKIRKKFFVLKSDSNFLFLKVADIKKAKKIFQKNKISVRIFNSGYAKDFIRITIGKKEENRIILNALNKL